MSEETVQNVELVTEDVETVTTKDHATEAINAAAQTTKKVDIEEVDAAEASTAVEKAPVAVRRCRRCPRKARASTRMRTVMRPAGTGTRRSRRSLSRRTHPKSLSHPRRSRRRPGARTAPGTARHHPRRRPRHPSRPRHRPRRRRGTAAPPKAPPKAPEPPPKAPKAPPKAPVLDPTTASVSAEYQGVCVGFFADESTGTPVMAACAKVDGKCPATFSAATCTPLAPVAATVSTAKLSFF